MVDLLNRHVGVGEMHHGLNIDHVLNPVGGGTPHSLSEIGGVLHPIVSHHTLHPLERPLLLHSLISLIFFLYVGVSFFDFFEFLYPPASIIKK